MPPRESAPRPGTRRTRTPPPDGIWGRRRAPKSARGQKVRQTSGPAPEIRRNADQPENPADAPDDVPEVRTGFRLLRKHTFDGGQFGVSAASTMRSISAGVAPPETAATGRRQKARPVRRQGEAGVARTSAAATATAFGVPEEASSSAATVQSFWCPSPAMIRMLRSCPASRASAVTGNRNTPLSSVVPCNSRAPVVASKTSRSPA